MDTALKNNIVGKILAKIPEYLNPVDFLHQTLDISKESVYRRIKGEIAFTLEDIIKLSSKLSFSLDEIVFMNNEEECSGYQPGLFQFRSNKMNDPQVTFQNTLSSYVQGKERVRKAKESEILVATNRLMILTTVFYEHIFKFYYYKWIHQTQQKPLNFSMSDVIVSDRITALREKLMTYRPAGNHMYLLDNNFLKNTLREVRYYYKRKLISEDEIVLLQNDFFKFVDVMEYMIKQPIDIDGYTNRIYISATQIDSTGMYCRTDDTETLDLWISYGSNIHTPNAEICKSYVLWINSLKKYSSLITGCNEALQTEFIDRQRNYIETLTSEDYTYE